MAERKLRVSPDLVCAVLLIAAWAGLLILRLVPVGGSWGVIDSDTLLLIVLWVSVSAISVVAGGWLASRGTRSGATDARIYRFDQVAATNIGLIVLSLAALIGAALIVFEFAFVRGYGFSTPTANIRVVEINRYIAGSSSSLISGPGRLMMPAILPAIVLAICFWRSLSFGAILTFALACCTVLLEQLMFEGGRLFLAAIYIVTAVALFSDLFKSDGRSTMRKIVTMTSILVVFGLILISYFGWVFLARFNDRGEALPDAYERFSSQVMEEQPVVPSADIALSAPEAAPAAEPATEIAIASPEAQNDKGAEASPTVKFFWLYATHGIDQLGHVIHFDYDSHTNGFFTFPQVAQVIDRTFGTKLGVDYFGNMPSIGLYTTLIGPIYIDFGYFGSLVFAGLFSLLLGYTARKGFFIQSPTFAKMAFPLLVSVAAFSPVVSIVNHIWPTLVWALLAGTVMTWPTEDSGQPGDNRGATATI